MRPLVSNVQVDEFAVIFVILNQTTVSCSVNCIVNESHAQLKFMDCTAKNSAFRPGKKLRYLTQKIGGGLMRQDNTEDIDLYAAMLKVPVYFE